MSTLAQSLKAEADTLFRSQEYRSASEKYSEAIKLESRNPILYANHALCHLKLKHYLDALAAANMAVSIHPSYVKAHIRRAEANDALHRDHIGQEAWQIALNALPKDNLTASDIATKEACERGYAKSKKRGEDVAAQVKRERNSTEEYPLWRRVQALSDARPTGLILKANSSFCQAKLASDSYRKVTELLEDMMHRYNFASDNYLLPNGSPITALVRVILHDPRFLFTWDDTWLSKVLHFAEHENTGANGWMDSNFDEQFRESVMERLRQKGWNFTRIPLVITVQCWIVRGIMIEGPGIKRVEHLYKALQVVRWARTTLMPEEFAKLENSDRYNELELLSPAFLLAVQKTYLDSIIECMEPNIVADDKKPHLLEEIRSEAEELLLKVSSMPRDDEALYAVAYQDFPRGIAHAALGTYYCERAYLATPPLPQAEFEELMKKSSEQFRQAVLWFPEGDEYRARYLHLALEGMIAGGDTLLGALMGTLRLLEKAIDEMRPIWGIGTVLFRRERVQKVINLLENVRLQYALGVYRGDMIVRYPRPERICVPIG